MRLQEPDAQPAASVSAVAAIPSYPTTPIARIVDFFSKTYTIVEWEARKLRHDYTDLITRAVQPALWLLIFGEVFARLHAVPTNGGSYLDFIAPGILAQSVLFLSIFTGIAIVWERDLGVIHKFLASPAPRSAIVFGKSLSTGVRALPQAAVIYLLAIVLGVHMNFNPLALLGVVLFVVIGATCFSTFSLIVACMLKSRDRVMGFGQVLTMPLFFASNAIYPISIMPSWIGFIATINPLTYIVDGLRSLMLASAVINLPSLGFDFLILCGITFVLIVIGSLLYPKIVQ